MNRAWRKRSHPIEKLPRLSGGTLPGTGGAGAPAEHQIMGNSNQPTSKNNISKAGSLKTLSLDRFGRAGSGNTGSDPGGAAAVMESSTQSFNSRSTAEANPVKLDDGYPSSLRSSSTCTSYSLEISLSTSNNENESQPQPLQTPPESGNDRNEQINPSIRPAGTEPSSYRPSAPKPLENPAESTAAEVRQCTDMLGNCRMVTSGEPHVEKTFSSICSGSGKLGAQPVSPGQPPSFERMESVSKEQQTWEDVEDMFYAFVILHAPEDAEEAARLKTRLEKISSMTGAVFAEDFAEPGRSTFRCVEDAIGNSAFTMLLLTPNFNTHLNEMNTDSALLNSIEKSHKYNTVIPLLPQDNSLTRSELPMVLRTKIPMKEKEDKVFEVMVRKVLDPGKIRAQKKIWKEEQLVKKQRERQRRLQEENRRRTEIVRESSKLRELEQQRLQLQQQLSRSCAPQQHLLQDFSGGAQRFGPVFPQGQDPGPPLYSGAGWQQPPSSIHIQNAKYIMIGNDSTMTVGGGGGGGDDSGDEDGS